ncbi:MAG TPA: ATP-binding protein [Candidatus Bathyarchaeia archaeon]|nr:ATP-binding protein [Candidatus Bathyarchaeia archaeon]
MRGIKRRIVTGYGIVILLVILLMEGVFILAVHQFYLEGAKEALKTRVATSADFFNKYVQAYDLKERAKTILENLPEGEVARVEIIDLQGRVILDSYGIVSGRQVDQPDVALALKGSQAVWSGHLAITHERVIAVSSPLQDNISGKMDGVLRYTVSAEPLYAVVRDIVAIAVAVGVAVLLLSFAVSIILANRLIRPVLELTERVKQVTRGDFAQRVEYRGDDEVGSLAETFNNMAEALTKNEQLKNDFISSVSHELRTPLTSIKGWSETILTGDMADREETLQGLQVITRETDRLIGMVEELLDFSKIQSGQLSIDFKKVELGKVIHVVHEQLQSLLARQGIKFQVSLPQQSMDVWGDAHRLQQVFLNLLDNARKFTQPGGWIEVAVQMRENEIIVQIKDNGAGIPAEDLPYIKDKFYKGKSRKSGSGLGLAICTDIIERHHGNLEITSKEGVGTIAAVTLPLIGTR